MCINFNLILKHFAPRYLCGSLLNFFQVSAQMTHSGKSSLNNSAKPALSKIFFYLLCIYLSSIYLLSVYTSGCLLQYNGSFPRAGAFSISFTTISLSILKSGWHTITNYWINIEWMHYQKYFLLCLITWTFWLSY